MIDRARVSATVQSMLASATGKPCGLGSLPLVAGRPAPLPYTVLYPLGGPVDGAPLSDRSEDAHLLYQVTIVAVRTDQAEWLGDRVRHAVLGRAESGEWAQPLTTPGVHIWARVLVVDEGVNQSQASDGVVTSAQRYRLSLST